MNDQVINHETCSELLRGYLRDELDAARSASVARHLEGCAECRAEADALVRLTSPTPGLDDLERQRVRAAVRSALEADRHAGVRPARRDWRARVAPTQGAAALLGLVAVAAINVIGNGGDVDGDAALVGQSGEQNEGARAPGPPPSPKVEKDSAVRKGKVAAQDALTEGVARPTNFDASLGNLQGTRLAMVAERRAERYANAYATGELAPLQKGALRDLAAQAPPPVRDQIRACVAAVEQARGDAVVPTFGGLGRIGSRRALVVGFAWSPGGAGTLSRYMLWAWPRGSCATTLEYLEGALD